MSSIDSETPGNGLVVDPANYAYAPVHLATAQAEY
jgi:hypothetical protein